MEKPFVVCHMFTSLDGKIDGAYMTDPRAVPARETYGKLRGFYDCQATLYGTTTMAGGFSFGLAPKLSKAGTAYPKEDYVASSDVANYIVSVDPEGILGWNSKYLELKGRPKAHVIQVLTEKVSQAYLAYLHKFDISYIFAGKDQLDCSLLLYKLKTLFHIDRLMIAGGGTINWSFAQEDLIDELSLVIAPVADGNTSSVSIFERMESFPQRSPAAFSLKAVERVDGDGVWLRYALKK